MTNVPVKKESEEAEALFPKPLQNVCYQFLQSPTGTEAALALFDSLCSHSCISEKLAAIFHVQGTATKVTVHGNNSKQKN